MYISGRRNRGCATMLRLTTNRAIVNISLLYFNLVILLGTNNNIFCDCQIYHYLNKNDLHPIELGKFSINFKLAFLIFIILSLGEHPYPEIILSEKIFSLKFSKFSLSILDKLDVEYIISPEELEIEDEYSNYLENIYQYYFNTLYRGD